MRVLESRAEPAGPGLIKITVLIDDQQEGDQASVEEDGLGEGPTGEAVPDRIVQSLIDHRTLPSLPLVEIRRFVGGHPGTVNRQAWTLANNAPDLQHRLRGWVFSPERGRYALTAKARRRLEVSV